MKKCIVCNSEIKGEPRSISQNAYFHVICHIAGNDLGYDKDEMKEVFRRAFLPAKIIKIGKSEYTLYTSTTSLNKQEFMVMIDQCIRLCGDLGIVIPPPEEYYYETHYPNRK